MRERLYRFFVSTPPRVAFARPWPGTRRGLVLWELSLAVVLIGAVNYIGTTLPPRAEEALRPVLHLAPATAWGWVFVVVGLLCAYTSYCHFDRDQIGYTVAAVSTGCWSAVYLIGFVADWHADGAPEWRTLGSAVIWFAFCGVLMTCAAFPKTPLDFGARATDEAS